MIKWKLKNVDVWLAALFSVVVIWGLDAPDGYDKFIEAVLHDMLYGMIAFMIMLSFFRCVADRFGKEGS